MKIQRIAGFAYEGKGGNPAGVVVLETMPGDEVMLKIAKEVNYSETAFLVKEKDKTYRVRYFSPEVEIDFCGHATIASGQALVDIDGTGQYELVLNHGSIFIDVEEVAGTLRTAITSVKTHTKPVEDRVTEAFLDVFNFDKEAVDRKYPVQIAYSGNDHLIIFLKKKETLEKMVYDFDAAKALCERYKIVTISLVYTEDGITYHKRNPFPYGGVYEDPATGSAAIALGEYLRSTGHKDQGAIEILQGFDMGVPSKLYVHYDATPNSPVTVSGESRLIT